MLDYRVAVHLVAESYRESLRPERTPAAEGLQGNDIEFAVRMERAPTWCPHGIWPLPDNAFSQAIASRDPFWTTLVRDGERFACTANDRGESALGYLRSPGSAIS